MVHQDIYLCFELTLMIKVSNIRGFSLALSLSIDKTIDRSKEKEALDEKEPDSCFPDSCHTGYGWL